MKTELRLKFDGNAVMQGFCYSYSRMLVDAAKQLLCSGKIFKLSPKEYQITRLKVNADADVSAMPGVLDNFAGAVLSCIVQQIPMDIAVGTTITLNEVEEILDVAEKFLNIFEGEEHKGGLK